MYIRDLTSKAFTIPLVNGLMMLMILDQNQRFKVKVSTKMKKTLPSLGINCPNSKNISKVRKNKTFLESSTACSRDNQTRMILHIRPVDKKKLSQIGSLI